MKTVMDGTTYYAMLVAPFLLALVLTVIVQNSNQPLKNDRAYQQAGETPPVVAEARVKDRVSLMVVFEVFALTLIIRPWQFPWRASRFLGAEVVFFLWGALVVPMAMHGGRLLGLHALGVMALLGFVLPVCVFVLFARDFFDNSG